MRSIIKNAPPLPAVWVMFLASENLNIPQTQTNLINARINIGLREDGTKGIATVQRTVACVFACDTGETYMWAVQWQPTMRNHQFDVPGWFLATGDETQQFRDVMHWLDTGNLPELERRYRPPGFKPYKPGEL